MSRRPARNARPGRVAESRERPAPPPLPIEIWRRVFELSGQLVEKVGPPAARLYEQATNAAGARFSERLDSKERGKQ